MKINNNKGFSFSVTEIFLSSYINFCHLSTLTAFSFPSSPQSPLGKVTDTDMALLHAINTREPMH